MAVDIPFKFILLIVLSIPNEYIDDFLLSTKIDLFLKR